MRYTRDRQLRKINSIMESTWCLTIKDSVNHVWCDKIDPTFKWHRVFNQVSYKEQYKGLESYVVVGLYSKRISRLVNSK